MWRGQTKRTTSRSASSTSASRRLRSFCSWAARPCSPGPTCSATGSRVPGATSCGTTCATQARRPQSIPRLRRTHCAILPPTPRRSPANSTTGLRTWRASASAGWSPRSPHSTTRTRSQRSPSSGRGPWLPGRSTTTCLTMTRRPWSGCSRARCPTGPTVLLSQSMPPKVQASSATTPPLHGQRGTQVGPLPEYGARRADG